MGDFMERLTDWVYTFSVVLFLAIASLAGADDRAAAVTSFNSPAAVQARSSGSPVGPPARVTICHNGTTLSVAEPAVASHLAHGDTLGPCDPNPGPGDNPNGNNGVGNGADPQPPGNPPVNDGPGTGPGNPGSKP